MLLPHVHAERVSCPGVSPPAIAERIGGVLSPAIEAGTDISAAERTAGAMAGAWLFRYRGVLPVPLLLVLFVVAAHTSLLYYVVGSLLVGIGEAVRLVGVAAAGPETRRRSRHVHQLVTHGAFAWTRNPLYVGNGVIWIGFAVMSGVPWLVPTAAAVFAAEYSLIVSYEEGVLESIFGEKYLLYKRSTPRWIPQPPSFRHSPVGSVVQPISTYRTHRWATAWRSETSTLLQYAALAVMMVVKHQG